MLTKTFSGIFVRRLRVSIFSIHSRNITDADILKGLKFVGTKPLLRESKYDRNVKYLLPLLAEGKYTEVQQLVKSKNININSHNTWENTPLTDAAKRGDVKAIKFLINVMKANPHASCDCPHHKTPLHYSVENDHYEATNTLLDLGADPNALDSRNYTALDIAKNKNMQRLLQSKNGVSGTRIRVSGGQRLNLPKADCPSLKLNFK
jgi:hypothetical protein